MHIWHSSTLSIKASPRLSVKSSPGHYHRSRDATRVPTHRAHIYHHYITTTAGRNILPSRLDGERGGVWQITQVLLVILHRHSPASAILDDCPTHQLSPAQLLHHSLMRQGQHRMRKILPAISPAPTLHVTIRTSQQWIEIMARRQDHRLRISVVGCRSPQTGPSPALHPLHFGCLPIWKTHDMRRS